MRKLYRTTGIFGVAVLALTACGPDEEETTAGDDSPDDSAQEDVDPDGAEEQGDTPGEIADEDGEEPDPDEAQGNGGEAPELSEIGDEVWEASLAEDSVTVTAEVPAALFGMEELPTDELEDGTEDSGAEDDELEAEFEGETVEIIISGDMQGNGSTWQMADIIDYRLFDEGSTIYQSADSFIEEYTSLQPDAQAGADPEALRQELEAQGAEWIDVSSTLSGQIETPEQFIANFRDDMLQEAGISSLGEAPLTGESENRDGEDVWVYREEDGEEYLEFVFLADESAPVLHEIDMNVEGMVMNITFSDWSEAEPEEEPTEALSEEELNAIGESAM